VAGIAWLAWLIWALDGLLPRPYTAEYVIGWFVFGAMNWICVVAMLGAARFFIRAPNHVLAYTGDVVLPFYLVHQTVLAILAYFVVRLSAGIPVKYALLVVSSTALALIVVEAARLTPLTRYLLGLRQRFPPRTGSGAPAFNSSETVTT
jgi:surface polysaccharide O-acyltransferase-like enzyme